MKTRPSLNLALLSLLLGLPGMAAPAPTAPYGCAKSKRIFEQGCEAILAIEKLIKEIEADQHPAPC